MSKNIMGVFPTPVGIYEINYDCQIIYENLKSFSTSPHGLLENSQSSYGQESNVLYDLRMSRLHESIQFCLDDYTSNIGLQPLVVTGSWYNKMDLGSKVNLHRHEGSVVSGVFYVLAENASPIKFKNPLYPYKMNDLYDNIDSEFSTFGIQLIPKTGNLILFPSWLEHETNEESGKRCVISFNTLYKSIFFPNF
jgi:uncharacterized protein (TIGR02466 family)